MQCPVCGHDEERGTACSQCHTPFPAAEQKEPAPAVKNPASKHTPAPKQGKHRPRPLHDLDLTIPELEVKSGPANPPQATHEIAAAAPTEGRDVHAPVDFSSFILSLAASAVTAMGGPPAPGHPPTSNVDLAQAKDVIDLLEVLEIKTRGNLTPEEGNLLSQTRASLQKRFNSLLIK